MPQESQAAIGVGGLRCTEKNAPMLPQIANEIEPPHSGFLFIRAILQTENFGAMIKEPTVTDLVKRCERIWRDRHFKIIVPDVVVGEITARTIDAEEERPIRTFQQEAGDSGGRRYCCGKCTVTNRRHPGILNDVNSMLSGSRS